MRKPERCPSCNSFKVRKVKDDLIFCSQCKSYFHSYLAADDEDEQGHLKIADAII